MTKNILPRLATKATLSVLDKLERKISQKGVVRARKGFTLLISNVHMDDITRIIISLQDSVLITDGATGTVSMKKKKRKSEFFGAMMALMAASLAAPMASSLMESVASSVINAIFGKGLKGGLALPLIMKVLGKGVKRAWKDIIK